MFVKNGYISDIERYKKIFLFSKINLFKSMVNGVTLVVQTRKQKAIGNGVKMEVA